MWNDGIEANDVLRTISGVEGQVLYGTEFFGEVLNTTGRVAPARNPDERCNPATWKESFDGATIASKLFEVFASRE